MKKRHYAWAICTAGTLLIVITMGAVSNGFSIYMPYIRDSFGLTNAQTSTLVSLRHLTAFFCLLLIGKYYDILNIRVGATIAAAFGALAFLIYAFAQNYPVFATAAAISGISYGMGSMVPVSILMNRWFDDHKALAISICSAGSGIGAIVLPPVITGLLNVFSMRTVFLMEAAFIAVLTVIIFLLIRNDPNEMQLTKLGAKVQEPSQVKEATSTKLPDQGKSSLLRSVIIIGALGCFFMGAQGNPGMTHVPVLYTSAGSTPELAATLLSIVGGAIIVGKLIYGELTDKHGGLRSSMAFCVILIAGNILCCTANSGSVPLSLVAAFTLGIGYSVSTVGPSLWAGDLSAKSEYPSTIRWFQIAYSFGALVGAGMPGILADRYGGSYVPAYMVFTALAVIGTLLILISYKKQGH